MISCWQSQDFGRLLLRIAAQLVNYSCCLNSMSFSHFCNNRNLPSTLTSTLHGIVYIESSLRISLHYFLYYLPWTAPLLPWCICTYAFLQVSTTTNLYHGQLLYYPGVYAPTRSYKSQPLQIFTMDSSSTTLVYMHLRVPTSLNH